MTSEYLAIGKNQSIKKSGRCEREKPTQDHNHELFSWSIRKNIVSSQEMPRAPMSKSKGELSILNPSLGL